MFVILRHADVGQIFRHAIARNGLVEFFGAWQIASVLCVQSAVARQSARNLARAVGAKVETDADIVVANRRQRLAAAVDARRTAR